MLTELLNDWLPAWRLPFVADDAVLAHDDSQRDDYRVLSSGLRAVLSRCSARCAKQQFPASVQVDRRLRLHLALRVPVRLCPYLLNDALHEIARHVERPVRDAALRCVRRARQAA